MRSKLEIELRQAIEELVKAEIALNEADDKAVEARRQLSDVLAKVPFEETKDATP